MTEEASDDRPGRPGSQTRVRRADDPARPLRIRVDVRRPPEAIEVRFEVRRHDRCRWPGRAVGRGSG